MSISTSDITLPGCEVELLLIFVDIKDNIVISINWFESNQIVMRQFIFLRISYHLGCFVYAVSRYNWLTAVDRACFFWAWSYFVIFIECIFRTPNYLVSAVIYPQFRDVIYSIFSAHSPLDCEGCLLLKRTNISTHSFLRVALCIAILPVAIVVVVVVVVCKHVIYTYLSPIFRVHCCHWVKCCEW